MKCYTMSYWFLTSPLLSKNDKSFTFSWKAYWMYTAEKLGMCQYVPYCICISCMFYDRAPPLCCGKSNWMYTANKRAPAIAKHAASGPTPAVAMVIPPGWPGPAHFLTE